MHSSDRIITCTLAGFVVAATLGCAGRPGSVEPWSVTEFALPQPPIVADSSRARLVAPGVVHRYYWMREGPWALHVLDVDREACWTLSAAKSGSAAVGRERTSAILDAAGAGARRVVAGVNADFFLFSPPGVPVGAHVQDGRVVAGPGTRPVFLVDSSGAARVDTLRVTGWLAAASFGAEIGAWNRPRADALALFDANWGAATDTATNALEVVLSAGPRGAVIALDTLPSGVPVPDRGAVLVLGHSAPAVLRMQLSRLRPGVDSVDVAIALSPTHPREAVGGFPILVRDGVEVANLESAGGARFGPARHPRTAVGIDEAGRRLFLVVVDGRQAPYSDGMTLPELAAFMRGLGAHEALNLDGGGSTTMAIVPPGGRPGGAARPVNRPSDREGERPVGNALVIERAVIGGGAPGARTCRPRSASR